MALQYMIYVLLLRPYVAFASSCGKYCDQEATLVVCTAVS